MKLFEIGPLAYEEMLSKEIDGRIDEGQIYITIAHLEHFMLW